MGGRSGGVRRIRRQSGDKDQTSYVERKFRVIAINGDEVLHLAPFQVLVART